MLPRHITLPPPNRSTAGLLAAARALERDEWWRGVAFAQVGCAPPSWRGPCTDGNNEPNGIGADHTFAPITVRQGVECSTLSRSDIEDLGVRRLDATREFAVARALLTGENTEHGDPASPDLNPSLRGQAEEFSTQDSITEAIALAEEEIADNFRGMRAFIHVPPRLAPFISTHTGEARTVFRTLAGNTVVVSPGYDGAAPDGSLTITERWVYVSSEVHAETGMREVFSNVDRNENTDVAWAQELALALFDPCWVGAIPVDIGGTS